METENKKCKNCGGYLEFNPESQLLVCKYCQSSFSMEEDLDETLSKDNEEYCQNLNECRCSSCGATMIIDDTTATTTCVYCHSPITITKKLEGDIKPDTLIPFKFNVEEAKQKFIQHTKKYFFVPKKYFSTSLLDYTQGIYYPFWIVDVDLDAEATFIAKEEDRWSNSNYRYVKTSIYRLLRAGEIHLEDVSSCAIKGVDRAMLEGIFPFPKNEYLNFNKSYLIGYKTQKRDLEKSDLTKDVHEKIKVYSIDNLQSEDVRKFDHIETETFNYNIKNESWSYSLLPIYLLTHTKNGKTYKYAMNGYTGKIYGKYPISALKMFILNAILILITLLITFSLKQTSSETILICGGICLVVILIVNLIIFGKYKKNLGNIPYPIKELSTINRTKSHTRLIDTRIIKHRIARNDD